MRPSSDHGEPIASDDASGVAIQLEGLTVAAGDRVLLEDGDARFAAGQVTLIVGPSGVGKSILLRVLAGLIEPTDPGIRWSGRIRFDRADAPPAVRRRAVGVVFQDFALFDELSPLDNVRLARAHRRRRCDGADTWPPAEQWLRELAIPDDVRTASLSGGQRQRLAVARTLAYGPDVILYDEPTSGLDAITATEVARLIQATHATHPKTSIVVTHDFDVLAPIADRVYLFDAATRRLRELSRSQWDRIGDQMVPVASDVTGAAGTRDGATTRAVAGRWGAKVTDLLAATTRAVETVLQIPWRLLPAWRSPWWGLRFLAHYLRLIAGPSAWVYLAVSGMIVGFVTTYFAFRFLPYEQYTKPLLIENLLTSIGFALYRILVPVLATILIAARCGAAVASDIGGKSYGRQMDAMRTMGVGPPRYLLTPILQAFLIGTPLLTLFSYYLSAITSLVVFVATHPARGPDFWNLHFHRRLAAPDQLFFSGTWWLLAKLLLCAAGIGLIAYHRAARPKHSTRDVSSGITSTILWATLYVLLVHFAFAFFEFEANA